MALTAARVAVFLISPDFLASDFIQDRELPVLLEAAERHGTRMLPVILSHCLYKDSPLGRYQAINAPERPLEQLTKAGRDKALNDLARVIAAARSDKADVTAPAPSSNGRHRVLRQAVPASIPGSTDAVLPQGSPGDGRSTQRLIGTWIFGGLLLAFLFVFVMVWWLSPLAPIESTDITDEAVGLDPPIRMQTLAGNIRNARTGKPVPDVQVSLPEYGVQVQSDALGRFEMQVTAPYQVGVELMVHKPGHRVHEQYATLGNRSLDVDLEEADP